MFCEYMEQEKIKLFIISEFSDVWFCQIFKKDFADITEVKQEERKKPKFRIFKTSDILLC